MKNATDTAWFTQPELKGKYEARLVCFPGAGGNARVFNGWQDRVPSFARVCPIHLPGRGRRLLEPPFRRVEPLVEALIGPLLPLLNEPFALYGHSMGSLIAFELARKLQWDHGISPAFLFVSGRRAPHLPPGESPSYNLPGPEFEARVRELGGTPEELLNNPEAMALFIPVLRADFELVQTYRFSAGQRLRCPILAFRGVDDAHACEQNVRAWGEHSTASFSMRTLSGGHFLDARSESETLTAISCYLHRAFGR